MVNPADWHVGSKHDRRQGVRGPGGPETAQVRVSGLGTGQTVGGVQEHALRFRGEVAGERQRGGLRRNHLNRGPWAPLDVDPGDRVTISDLHDDDVAEDRPPTRGRFTNHFIGWSVRTARGGMCAEPTRM